MVNSSTVAVCFSGSDSEELACDGRATSCELCTKGCVEVVLELSSFSCFVEGGICPPLQTERFTSPDIQAADVASRVSDLHW